MFSEYDSLGKKKKKAKKKVVTSVAKGFVPKPAPSLIPSAGEIWQGKGFIIAAVGLGLIVYLMLRK